MASIEWLPDHALALCSPALGRLLENLPFPEVLGHTPLIIDEHFPEWAPWLAALGITTERGITLEDVRLRLQAAEDDLGIAMVSARVADAAVQRGRVTTLQQIPAYPLPALWLTKSRLAPRTPAVDVVFEWLHSLT